MSGVGFWELIILFFIGLIVLGPERLPRVANQIGGWLGQARRMTRVMKRQLEDELNIEKDFSIKPPSREPSTQPTPQKSTVENPSSQEREDALPRDDDDYSPAHDADDLGTGVHDDDHYVDNEDQVESTIDPSTADKADDNVVDSSVHTDENQEVKEAS